MAKLATRRNRQGPSHAPGWTIPWVLTGCVAPMDSGHADLRPGLWRQRTGHRRRWVRPSGSFLDILILVVLCLVRGCAGAGWVYDLSRGRGGPAVEVEQVVEGALVGVHVGGDAAGFGSSAGGGVDQHGFLDTAQGVKDGPDG